MQGTRRILILEDRVRDAELLLYELRKGDFDFEWQRVESEPDFIEALSPPPDIILADYSMPQFDASRALEILREQELDIPFIIVSGTIGEDAAVAAMKAGANDFFAKNRLTRLLPALERELRESQERRRRRQAETELHSAEERFVKAFQLSPLGISITVVEDERFLDINESFLKMSGFTRDEVIGHTPAELNIWLHPEDETRMKRALEGRTSIRDWENQFRTKSGEIRDGLISLERIDLENSACILSLFHDITERKQSEMAIRESEERFRLLAQNSTDMISRHDTEGVYLYVSPASSTLLGYAPEELNGHSCFEFIHPDYVDAVRQSLKLARDSFRSEYRIRRKDGGYVWLETTNRVIRGPETHEILEIQAASRDISERKQSEEALQRYNQRLKTLHSIDQAILNAQSPELVTHLALRYFMEQIEVPAASFVVFEFELREGLVIFASAGEPAPATRHLALEEWSPEDRELLRTGVVQIIEDNSLEPLPAGIRALGHDGYHAFLRVPLISQGELIGTLNLAAEQPANFIAEYQEIAHEIADQVAIAIQQTRMSAQIRRHNAELEERVIERTAELASAKTRVESILHNSSDAIVLATASGSIDQTNPGFEQFFGYEGDEAYGLSLSQLVEPELIEALKQAIETVIAENRRMRLEAVCRRKDGTTVNADIAIAMLPATRRDQRSIICSVRDMTERKHMEQELRQALEQERELNELKSRFVSTVSHEFRTPLTSIMSSSQLLKLYIDRMNEDRRVEHLDRIETQVRRLTELLDDVLALSKAEAVGFDFNPVTLDLETFCRGVAEEIQVITKSPHEIAFSGSGNCSKFSGDEKLLRHIIINLLTNAIKYSPNGGMVEFTLTCDQVQAEILIADSGLGIPEDDQKHLFEPFHRARNVGDISGTGLGLPIVKRAVDAHGGTISVDSTEGVGTTMIVRLPLSR